MPNNFEINTNIILHNINIYFSICIIGKYIKTDTNEKSVYNYSTRNTELTNFK